MTSNTQPAGPLIEAPTTALRSADVLELFAAVENHDHRHPLSERKWLDLAAGYRHGSFGIAARQNAALVGYAHVWHGSSAGRNDWSLEVVVHPALRPGELTAQLIDGAVQACRSRDGGVVRAWFAGPTAENEALVRGRGFAPSRDLHELRRPLPMDEATELPPTARLRTFEPGADDAAWLELNNSAFRAHPEQGLWTEDDLLTRMQQPWFDPGGLLLLEEGGRLVGSCWTKRHGHEGIGEIYVVGVDPREHGRRLGRALTIAGLDSLWRRGATVGMLYCDAGNDVAMHLYTKLGFTMHLLHRSYALDLDG